MEVMIVSLLGAVLAAMLGGFSALWYRLGKLEGTVVSLRERMTGFEERMRGFEERMGRFEERVARLEEGMARVEERLAKVEIRQNGA